LEKTLKANNEQIKTPYNKGLASGGANVPVRQFFVNLGFVARSDFSCRKSRPNAKPRTVACNPNRHSLQV